MTSLTDIADRATISVEEAGALLGLSRNTAYAAAKRGEIPTLQIGRRLIVPVPRLLALLGVDLPHRDGPAGESGAAVSSDRDNDRGVHDAE